MAFQTTLTLLNCNRSRHQLVFYFGLDDLRFSTSLWYGDVDFFALEMRFGSQFMRKIYFHMMLACLAIYRQRLLYKFGRPSITMSGHNGVMKTISQTIKGLNFCNQLQKILPQE